ncbi:MAG: hypothetical protein Q4A54_04280 [Parabacteroides sp.]|nr:hypothetical protein [Parabacteroides sp.]
MDNKKDDLLSIQWQTCVEMANSVSQRRDTMNNLFITLNLAIIAGISLVGGTKTIMMIVAGVIVCAVWILFINNFKELNSAKFAIINTLEESMINKPFTEEWRIIKDNKKYVEGTKLEKAFPICFIAVYIVALIFILIK